MDSHLTMRRSGLDVAPIGDLVRQLRVVAGGLLCGALWIGAALLLARRMAGAFDAPLSPAGLLLAGLLLSSLALLGGWLLADASNRHGRTKRSLVRWLPLGAAASAAMALSQPQSSPAGLTVLWFCLALAGVLSFSLDRPAWISTRLFESPSVRRMNLGPSKRRRSSATPRNAGPARPSAGDELQWMVRKALSGREAIRGRIRAVVPAGRRGGSAHVAFCPPFRATPLVTVRPAATSGLTISPGQVLPHGVRFDVKLAAPLPRRARVRIEFVARESSEASGSDSP